MIPVEVVVRNIATGSYLKRNPSIAEGSDLGDVVEFFYKTKGRRIGEQVLPCDDPLMIWDAIENYYLYNPSMLIDDGQITRLDIPGDESKKLRSQLTKCHDIAGKVNEHLWEGWHNLGGELWDFKLEFGVNSEGKIVLADVVDCDSWRVMWRGIQLSKQVYRNGGNLEDVLMVYRLAK